MSDSFATPAGSRSRQIHDQLDHPVIDSDGHMLEFEPALFDLLRDVAGAATVDRFRNESYATNNFGNYCRVWQGQFLSHEPMRCRFESVKRSGSRKNESAGTNRGNTGATADGGSQCAEEFTGKGAIDIVDSRDNHSLGAFQRREPPGHA